jgi:hypothetical protein
MWPRKFMPVASQRLLFALLCFASLTVWVRQFWAVAAFQAGILILYASGAERIPIRYAAPVLALPLIGLVQLVTSQTSVASMTVEAVLHWGSLAAVFALTRYACQDARARSAFLTGAGAFGAAMSVLCLLQLHTSGGRFLWYFDTGLEGAIYASFGSYNNWAQFAELVLPITIWKIGNCQGRNALWAVSSGLLAASVAATGARAGTLICAALALASLGSLARSRGVPRGRLTVPLLAAPAAAIAFTMLAGTDLIWKRFHQEAPYEDRMQYLLSSIELVRDRPLLGWGLGTWPLVYPHKARIDDSVFVNRAHNDWAEAAADGGFIFLLALAAPLLWSVKWIWGKPWALGIAGVVVHAWVDYPFPRSGVSAWLFAMAGALWAAGETERSEESSETDASAFARPRTRDRASNTVASQEARGTSD